MTEPARIQHLNELPEGASGPGRYVLYWMQQSQRSALNHALEYAIERANALHLPVLVTFGLTDDYPEANLRHYTFMLEGLSDTCKTLERRGIRMVVRKGSPPDVALRYAKDAAMVVCDRGYLRHHKLWREQVANEAKCAVVQVESDVVVPVAVASDKAEYAARTIRPKIHRALATYLKPLKPAAVNAKSLDLDIRGDIDLNDIEAALPKLKLDRSVGRVTRFLGGQTEATRLLDIFIKQKLSRYDEDRNEPSLAATSFMSPYLHFGHISPIQIALAAKDSEPYLEELIVRRELAMNFVHHTSSYDSFDCLPAWARRTLESHASDARPYVYTRDLLEKSATHDPYWNAAQREMVLSGFMHNYMRMYWGKKILEWSRTPREAYETTLYLNNKYFLDGRDPVSYANVGWIFGLHDRPWTQRPIFGQIRYMNAKGLERKFDMEGYVRFVEELGKDRHWASAAIAIPQ